MTASPSPAPASPEPQDLVATAVAEQLRAQLGAGPIELAMHAHLGVGVR